MDRSNNARTQTHLRAHLISMSKPPGLNDSLGSTQPSQSHPSGQTREQKEAQLATLFSQVLHDQPSKEDHHKAISSAPSSAPGTNPETMFSDALRNFSASQQRHAQQQYRHNQYHSYRNPRYHNQSTFVSTYSPSQPIKAHYVPQQKEAESTPHPSPQQIDTNHPLLPIPSYVQQAPSTSSRAPAPETNYPSKQQPHTDRKHNEAPSSSKAPSSTSHPDTKANSEAILSLFKATPAAKDHAEKQPSEPLLSRPPTDGMNANQPTSTSPHTVPSLDSMQPESAHPGTAVSMPSFPSQPPPSSTQQATGSAEPPAHVSPPVQPLAPPPGLPPHEMMSTLNTASTEELTPSIRPPPLYSSPVYLSPQPSADSKSEAEHSYTHNTISPPASINQPGTIQHPPLQLAPSQPGDFGQAIPAIPDPFAPPPSAYTHPQPIDGTLEASSSNISLPPGIKAENGANSTHTNTSTESSLNTTLPSSSLDTSTSFTTQTAPPPQLFQQPVATGVYPPPSLPPHMAGFPAPPQAGPQSQSQLPLDLDKLLMQMLAQRTPEVSQQLYSLLVQADAESKNQNQQIQHQPQQPQQQQQQSIVYPPGGRQMPPADMFGQPLQTQSAPSFTSPPPLLPPTSAQNGMGYRTQPFPQQNTMHHTSSRSPPTDGLAQSSQTYAENSLKSFVRMPQDQANQMAYGMPVTAVNTQAHGHHTHTPAQPASQGGQAVPTHAIPTHHTDQQTGMRYYTLDGQPVIDQQHTHPQHQQQKPYPPQQQPHMHRRGSMEQMPLEEQRAIKSQSMPTFSTLPPSAHSHAGPYREPIMPMPSFAPPAGIVFFPPFQPPLPSHFFDRAVNDYVSRLRIDELRTFAKQHAEILSQELTQSHGDTIKRVELYGSTRSGLVTPESDVDLVVVTQETYKAVKKSQHDCRVERWRARLLDRIHYDYARKKYEKAMKKEAQKQMEAQKKMMEQAEQSDTKKSDEEKTGTSTGNGQPHSTTTTNTSSSSSLSSSSSSSTAAPHPHMMQAIPPFSSSAGPLYRSYLNQSQVVDPALDTLEGLPHPGTTASEFSVTVSDVASGLKMNNYPILDVITTARVPIVKFMLNKEKPDEEKKENAEKEIAPSEQQQPPNATQTSPPQTTSTSTSTAPKSTTDASKPTSSTTTPFSSHCDICIDNLYGIHNSRLINLYCQLDTRVRPLLLIIKHWAKMWNVGDSKNGTLSMYGWTLLVLNFLQTRSPPVIPSLQSDGYISVSADDKLMDIIIAGTHVRYSNDVDPWMRKDIRVFNCTFPTMEDFPQPLSTFNKHYLKDLQIIEEMEREDREREEREMEKKREMEKEQEEKEQDEKGEKEEAKESSSKEGTPFKDPQSTQQDDTQKADATEKGPTETKTDDGKTPEKADEKKEKEKEKEETRQLTPIQLAIKHLPPGINPSILNEPPPPPPPSPPPPSSKFPRRLENSEPLSSLIMSFFYHYNYCFRRNRHVACIKYGCVVEKTLLKWDRNYDHNRHFFCIHDPFEVNRDVGDVIYNLPTIVTALQDTYKALSLGCPFETIFDPDAAHQFLATHTLYQRRRSMDVRPHTREERGGDDKEKEKEKEKEGDGEKDVPIKAAYSADKARPLSPSSTSSPSGTAGASPRSPAAELTPQIPAAYPPGAFTNTTPYPQGAFAAANAQQMPYHGQHASPIYRSASTPSASGGHRVHSAQATSSSLRTDSTAAAHTPDQDEKTTPLNTTYSTPPLSEPSLSTMYNPQPSRFTYQTPRVGHSLADRFDPNRARQTSPHTSSASFSSSSSSSQHSTSAPSDATANSLAQNTVMTTTYSSGYGRQHYSTSRSNSTSGRPHTTTYYPQH